MNSKINLLIIIFILISCSKNEKLNVDLHNELDLLSHYPSAEITAPSTTYINQDFKDIKMLKNYRWSIFSHPNSEIKYSTNVNFVDDFIIEFYIGIDEKAWEESKKDKTDGVIFSIKDQNDNILYSKNLDPINNENDKGWIYQSVTINATQNEPITELIFITESGKNSSSDWAYWAEPKIKFNPKKESHINSDKVNIILITLDTVRKDYLNIYGNNWIQTPNINTIAKNGVLFENAYSSSSTTSPSHVSIFTSLNPYIHGVIGNDYHLANKVPTLTNILSENGYKTGAAVSVHHLNPQICGLGQSFDYYKHPKDTESSDRWQLINSGYSTVSSGIDFLDQNHNDPFFLWVHMYDAHMPYVPVSEYDRKYYSDNPYANTFTSMANAFYDQQFNINNEPWMIGIRDINYFKRQYGAEITYLDDQIKRIMDSLKRLHLEDNTMVIITADHGECLGEHSMYFNHWGLYEEETNVPLIISLPKSIPKNTRIDDYVSIIDIAPTVLDVIGIENDYSAEQVFDGLSLKPTWDNDESLERNHIKTNSLYYIQTAYIGERYKINWVIRDATYNVEHLTLMKNTVLVYDKINDPNDEKPVAGFIWDSQNNVKSIFSPEDSFHDKLMVIKDNAKSKPVPTVENIKALLLSGKQHHFIDKSLINDKNFFIEIQNGLNEMKNELNVDLMDKLKNVLDIGDLEDIYTKSMNITDPKFKEQMSSLGYTNN